MPLMPETEEVMVVFMVYIKCIANISSINVVIDNKIFIFRTDFIETK